MKTLKRLALAAALTAAAAVAAMVLVKLAALSPLLAGPAVGYVAYRTLARCEE